MGIEPVPIKMYGDPDADKKFKKTVSELNFLCFRYSSTLNKYRKKPIQRAIRRKTCYASMEILT
jgi:hypothetical protein